MATRPLALITGAASGIGRAVAQHLAKTHSLLLVDQAEFKEDIQAETFQFDVSNANEWHKVTDAIKERPVDFVMLNAGIGLKPSWTDPDGWRKIMDTNLFGIVNGIAAILPFIENKKATVVITGSKQGITNPPGNPAYNASKAAVKSLAESLSYDLRKTNIGVYLLIPGYTYTGMTRGTSTSKPDSAWTPDQVASYMFEKIEQKQFYILCPDNDVTNEIDHKRMAWNLRDITHGRPALSRWREETADEFQQYMKQ
jgi:NAD(P)-dependent dehydrogenase (short-subunit alcohol dehydrogenase family)